MKKERIDMKEFEGKKLLVLGGLILESDIVRHAQEMGAYVIVADYNPDAPAAKVADRFELISATDVASLVDFCKKEKKWHKLDMRLWRAS